MADDRKVALVHDWLVGMRGGEKVLEVLCELYPGATLFTLVHKPGAVSPVIDRMDIRTSYIEFLPGGMRHYQYYLPLFPNAIRSFDLTKYDLVISSSHAAAKGVKVRHDAIHICYCHTPMRYIWGQHDQYFGPGRAALPVRLAMTMVRPYLQKWDKDSARKVDYFMANSRHIREQIRQIYNRSSAVIYPPVDVDRFSVSPRDDGYYLVVSGLVPYKRIDLAIRAVSATGRRLVIIGKGGEERRLKALAGPSVTFLGFRSDDEVRSYLEGCRALLFPGEEDFGIVPVEAMACGKPVIAFGRGGALETVVDGVSGIFFHDQTPAALAEAIGRFEGMKFDPTAIRRHAESFNRARFVTEISAFINAHAGREAGNRQ